MASIAGPSRKLFLDELGSISSLPGISLSLLSSEDYEPTSTVQYVNSQLVAHGFARIPGLSLDGLANGDSEKVVKCLLGMLSQRMEDLGRTEELGSKLRTLTYEYERLQSMHHISVDNCANAEREMNLFKSKLAASQRLLATEISTHKQTSSELQRTRTALQYLRSTTQNELKRKDKELERILERWNRVADAQVKLTSAQSGLRCVNLIVGVEDHARSKGLMEEALEQAEEARRELLKENEGFRTVILGTANSLQRMVYNVKELGAETHIEEPTPFSHTAVFAPPTSSMPHPENAHAKFRELMSAFREAVSGIAQAATSCENTPETEEEITKLKGIVQSLRTELDRSRQSSSTLATQAQAVLDRFTTHASDRLVTGRDPTPEEAAEMSMELMGVPERDELREKLDRRSKELERERERFTEATVKLGKEKAALETERLKLLEEKRRWDVEQMLAELPPTPGPDPDLVSPPRPGKTKAKQTSPSSPRVRLRKAGGSRVTLKSPLKKTSKRVMGALSQKSDSVAPGRLGMIKKSIVFETLDGGQDPEAPQINAQSAAETGLQRSTTPEDSPPVTAPATVAAEMMASLALILPTTFTLPPPSPASSLAALDLVPISADTPVPPVSSLSTVSSFNSIPLATAARLSVPPLPRARSFPSPRTPRPLVHSHLKHAYSPAKPSPLSRILMIADSPPSPPPVPPIQEEDEPDEAESDIVVSPLPPFKLRANNADVPNRKLARGLKLEVTIDEPGPLRERTSADLNGYANADRKPMAAPVKSYLMSNGEKRFTTKEKGKGRAVPALQGVTASEKENIATVPQASCAGKTRAIISSGSGNANPRPKPARPAGSETRNSTVTGKAGSKPPPADKGTVSRAGTSNGLSRSEVGAGARVNTVRPGGARRVPVGSANAGKLVARRV